MVLDGSDVFERAGDDVVDGMIEGFYFNVDKRILVLVLVHVDRNNEIGINSSTKILDAKKCSLCAYVYQVISLWCFVLIYQNI